MTIRIGLLPGKWRTTPVIGVIFLQIIFVTLSAALKLPDNYDQSLRPNNEAVADYVKVAVQLVSIRDVTANEVTVDLILRKQWADPRLAGVVTREQIISNNLPEIWLPDLFIGNSVTSKQPEEHSSSIKIGSDGSVNHNERLAVKLNCPMRFVKFPFDKQECRLTISSFSYTRVHLDLIWHGLVNDDVIVYDAEYFLSAVDQSSRNVRTKEGEYAHLTLSFNLSRCGLSQVYRTLLPTLVFAAFSYATLFLQSTNDDDDDSKETSINLTRLAINALMILVVVIISQIGALNAPPAAAVTALDVWMIAVFVVILMIFFLNFLRVTLKWRLGAAVAGTKKLESSSETELSQKTRNTEPLLNKIERYLRLSVPIVFLLFSIIYFAVYLS